MRDGTCPACGGTEIYAARNGIALGEYAHVGLRPHVDPGFRGMLQQHQTEGMWSYLCAGCGLVEFRLQDPLAVDFARANWTRVPG